MSEYLVKRQSLENIADEIRVLSGTTEPLGLTEMATNVNDANDEVADQTDLIAQVASALLGKSILDGVETCTVTISNAGNYMAVLYPTYENGMFTPNYASCNYGASPAPFDMPKGHVIYIITGEGHTYLDAENAEIIFNVTDGHAGLDIMGIRVTGDVTITE